MSKYSTPRILTLSAFAATAVVTLAMSTSVSAATTEEIAGGLLEQAAGVLDIEITDPELLEELSDGLEYAIEDGVIPEEITLEIGEGLDTGTDPDGIEAILEVNIIDQIANWEEYAPMYRVAFETVRAEFQTCRAAAGSARSCAQGLGFKMQVASANDALTRLQLLEQQLTDSGVVLTDEERALLETERAELQAKIERAAAKLEGLDSSDPSVQNAKKDMVRIRESAGTADGSDATVQSNGPGNSGNKGNSGGNGNSGNNGGGNGNAGGSNAGGNGKPNGNGNGSGK